MSKISEATGREDKCPDETWGRQEGPRKKDKQEEGAHNPKASKTRTRQRSDGPAPRCGVSGGAHRSLRACT